MLTISYPNVHCLRLVRELIQLCTAFISYCLCFSPLQFGGARVAEGELSGRVDRHFSESLRPRRLVLPRLCSIVLC